MWPPTFRTRNPAIGDKDRSGPQPLPVHMCPGAHRRLPEKLQHFFGTDRAVDDYIRCIPNNNTGDDILAAMQKAGDLHRRLSADEGVNVMITLVSDTRDVYFIGGGKVAARIRHLLSVDGTLQSEFDRATAAGQSRRASRCQSQRQRNGVKLHRLVRATHKYARNFIAAFDLALVPELNTRSLVSRDRGRPLGSFSKRLLSAWAFASFHTGLHKVCAESGCRAWNCKEDFSTVLCSQCTCRAPVGRARVFRCANRACSGGPHYTSGRGTITIRTCMKACRTKRAKTDVDACVANEGINFGRVMLKSPEFASWVRNIDPAKTA